MSYKINIYKNLIKRKHLFFSSSVQKNGVCVKKISKKFEDFVRLLSFNSNNKTKFIYFLLFSFIFFEKNKVKNNKL